MGFEGFVGLRYLMAKRQRNVLSVITLISVAGVAVGVMALIVVLSVMGGFEGDLREKIIGTKAHIVITGEDGYLEDHAAIVRIVDGVDGVVGASAYVEGEVMVNSASNLQGVVLRGVDPLQHARISSLDEDMELGGLEYLSDPDSLPVDSGLVLQRDPGDDSPVSDRKLRTASARSTVSYIGSHHARFVERALSGKAPTPAPDDGATTLPDGEEDGAAGDGAGDGSGSPIPRPDLEPAPELAPQTPARRGHMRDDDPFLAEIDAADEAATEAATADDDPDSAAPTLAPKPDGQGAGHLRDDDPFLAEIDAADAADSTDASAGSSDAGADAADRGARPATGSLDAAADDDDDDGGMKAIPMGESKRVVDGLIVGKELRDNLAVFLGNEVNIMSPMGDIGPTGALPRSRPYRVVGVFYSGMYEYDTKYVYTTLESAQRFLNLDDRVTGIEVRVEDMDEAGEVKAALEAALADHPGVVVKDWRELNGNLFSALMLEKIAMFVILTFIILVASFSILCLLIMIVIEKGREIAIFKAMGASTASIMRVFMIQGGVIGVAGTAIGATLGLLLCWVIAGWGIELPADVYYLSHVPVEVRPLEVALICGAAVLISLLATLPPSVLAARLDPVEGLRYE